MVDCYVKIIREWDSENLTCSTKIPQSWRIADFQIRSNIGSVNMTIENVEIRQAEQPDIGKIAEIKVKGWKTAYKGIVDGKYLRSMNTADQTDRYNSYSLNTVFVAEADNEIAGFLRFYEYSSAVYEDKDIDCEIRELYVRPDLKRKGIGSKLFSFAVTYLKQKGKKKMYVGCFRENSDAKRFYEKMQGCLWKESLMEIDGKNYQIQSYIYNL